MHFFASCARGLEYLLVDELKALGAGDAREGLAGVSFSGTLELGYRAALWSRLASRMSLQLLSAPVDDAEGLYELACQVDWTEHLGPALSFAVRGSVRGHPAFRDSRYAALKVKDAVVDKIRSACGDRPSIERANPDVPLYVFIDRRAARIGLDLTGRPLHRRGYREQSVAAPLKETLAAAIVMRSGWLASPTSPLVDPLCGSGTLLIEAALMALGEAPGRLWAREIGLHWLGHDHDAWARAVEEIEERPERPGLPRIIGSDGSPQAVAAARANAHRARLTDQIEFRELELTDLAAPKTKMPGHIICNPPYGRRVGEAGELFDLYRLLGERLVGRFAGWQVALFSEHEDLCRAIPLSPHKRYRMYNGAVACSLLLFRVPEQAQPLSDGAEMVANRIRKNLKKIRKYLKKNNISCYRIYDADLPEYAAAVDVYDQWINVQEYAAPPSIPVALAQRRLLELTQGVQAALGHPPERLLVRQRRRQRAGDQYQRRGHQRREVWVSEGGLRFRLNLSDFLDTGLFLDHRQTRGLVRDWAAGKRVLNLFCYTGSFSVYAAAGGARGTTSIDLSANYLKWAADNLRENGFGEPRHRLIQADCLEWIKHEREVYDLIVVDPPTFSNSKRMRADFDLQRDHAMLLGQCARCLSAGGRILFSNNFRRFQLDSEALGRLNLNSEELTTRTVPPDFSRRRPHRAWLIGRDAV